MRTTDLMRNKNLLKNVLKLSDSNGKYQIRKKKSNEEIVWSELAKNQFKKKRSNSFENEEIVYGVCYRCLHNNWCTWNTAPVTRGVIEWIWDLKGDWNCPGFDYDGICVKTKSDGNLRQPSDILLFDNWIKIALTTTTKSSPTNPVRLRPIYK